MIQHVKNKKIVAIFKCIIFIQQFTCCLSNSLWLLFWCEPFEITFLNKITTKYLFWWRLFKIAYYGDLLQIEITLMQGCTDATYGTAQNSNRERRNVFKKIETVFCVLFCFCLFFVFVFVSVLLLLVVFLRLYVYRPIYRVSCCVKFLYNSN